MRQYFINLYKKYGVMDTFKLKQLRTYYKCNWSSFSFGERKSMNERLPIIENILKSRKA